MGQNTPPKWSKYETFSVDTGAFLVMVWSPLTTNKDGCSVCFKRDNYMEVKKFCMWQFVQQTWTEMASMPGW